MKAKSLARTNSYIAHSGKSEQFIIKNIASSTAVETGKSVSEVIKRVLALKLTKPAKL